jgi:hypothetical protein
MAGLKREQLATRPLADLHAIASQLGIVRFRLLRKRELADAILTAQGKAEGGGVAASRSARRRGARRARRQRRARVQSA